MNQLFRAIRRVLLVTFVTLSSNAALAQDFDSGAAVDMTGMFILSQEAAMMNAAGQRSESVIRQRSSASPQQATSATFKFVPSAARRRTNLASFVEKSRANDPAGAAKMQALFASTDIIGMIDQEMQQKFGMRANNVADAYAVWWVSAWMGSRGRTDDASPGQMAMVKRQATNALAATREFATATDAGKQEMAEAMLVQTMMIQATVDTYKSDPAMLAKTRAAIAKGASGMGLDLSKMTLTDQGFVPSGKTGAADPAPGAAEQALAANAAATPPVAANDTSPPYILLAAAGGAGLGGVFLLGKMMGRRG
jgi:hypothetical protein